MTRLSDLGAFFVRYEIQRLPPMAYCPPGCAWAEHQYKDRPVTVHVASLAEAQGVRFLCPTCMAKNGGPTGTHSIEVSFRDRGVVMDRFTITRTGDTLAIGSKSRTGDPSRWAVSGTGLDDLTLQPSVDCGCWHGFVTNGAAA